MFFFSLSAGIASGSIEQIYTTNVFGTNRLRDAIRPLLSSSGSIINLSSGLGSAGFNVDPSSPYKDFIAVAYSSSKYAVNGLTVEWHKEERQKGTQVRIVSVDPGEFFVFISSIFKRAG